MQYGIRLLNEDMEYKEFCSLLSGIMPKTPLGTVVGIRAEEDKGILEHYSEDQTRIRNEWRNNHNPFDSMTEEEKMEEVLRVQKAFAEAFG